MSLLNRKRILISIGVVALAGAAIYYQHSQNRPNEDELKFRTAVVDMGNITQTVTASGTLNPVALINVGSQVSGTVVELNADFNDRVKKIRCY